MNEIHQLIVRMATENRVWGYTRIRRALDNLGHRVARGTIANVLKEHGLDPAPERTRRRSWREFLATHWDVLAAADFFTVEVWMPDRSCRTSTEIAIATMTAPATAVRTAACTLDSGVAPRRLRTVVRRRCFGILCLHWRASSGE